MNESINGEFYRRLDNLERKLDITSDSLIRHLASCERLGQSAAESRNRVEEAVKALMSKLDGMADTQSQQLGALKLSKALYAALGVMATGIVWAMSHLVIMK